MSIVLVVWLIFQQCSALRRSLIKTGLKHSVACGVHGGHEPPKCGSLGRYPVKRLSDDPTSPDGAAEPDPTDQRIAQNEEDKVAQSKPYLRREPQIVALLRDRDMGTHDL